MYPLPRVVTPDDGSILIEWIHKNFRIGLSIESDIQESCWYLVSNDKLGNILLSGRVLDEDFSELTSKVAKFVLDYVSNQEGADE